jgi:magnesium-transporting ATPase (P-type)
MTLDFVQEVRAQNAVEALRRSVAVQAKVRRDGASRSAPIDQLVPGDIVELIAGDLIPADSRLLDSRDLFVNQALLTGEPYPAEKQASNVPLGAENPAGATNATLVHGWGRGGLLRSLGTDDRRCHLEDRSCRSNSIPRADATFHVSGIE